MQYLYTFERSERYSCEVSDMRVNRAGARHTLVEKCIRWVQSRVNRQVFRQGARLPSIRSLARMIGVSTFTVVAAYERLVAAGYLEARRGSGFYVRSRIANLMRLHAGPPHRSTLIGYCAACSWTPARRGPGSVYSPRRG